MNENCYVNSNTTMTNTLFQKLRTVEQEIFFVILGLQ